MKQPRRLRDKHYEIILDSIADGVFTVDPEMRIMSFNRAAEEITGISKKEAIGWECFEVLSTNFIIKKYS
jgi:PAS domain S-box-containing protein